MSWWGYGREHDDGLTEFVVQCVQGVDDEALVGDGNATLIEGVGKGA